MSILGWLSRKYGNIKRRLIDIRQNEAIAIRDFAYKAWDEINALGAAAICTLPVLIELVAQAQRLMPQSGRGAERAMWVMVELRELQGRLGASIETFNAKATLWEALISALVGELKKRGALRSE